MKMNKTAARKAIEIAAICCEEPAAKSPMITSAQACIETAEECFKKGDYKATASWSKRAITYTHGVFHPVVSMFDHIDID